MLNLQHFFSEDVDEIVVEVGELGIIVHIVWQFITLSLKTSMCPKQLNQ
jgi:hypothetical protein